MRLVPRFLKSNITSSGKHTGADRIIVPPRSQSILCLREMSFCLSQSESVKYFLDNLDRIGQLVSRPESQMHFVLGFFFHLFSKTLNSRATSRASRTSCSRGRRPKASWSTTSSSRRSPSRWWTSAGSGPRGRSGSSASTASRPSSSWSRRRSTIRYRPAPRFVVFVSPRPSEANRTETSEASTQSRLCGSSETHDCSSNQVI